MVLDIRLSPQTEAKLREQAAATGKDVGEIIQTAVEQLFASADNGKPADQTPAARARLWREWAQSHPPRPDVHLDDDREAIYFGRGE